MQMLPECSCGSKDILLGWRHALACIHWSTWSIVSALTAAAANEARPPAYAERSRTAVLPCSKAGRRDASLLCWHESSAAGLSSEAGLVLQLLSGYARPAIVEACSQPCPLHLISCFVSPCLLSRVLTVIQVVSALRGRQSSSAGRWRQRRR